MFFGLRRVATAFAAISGRCMYETIALLSRCTISLLVPPRTRKFGRYMMFGVVATAVVVVGVALGVLFFLLSRDN